jgi:hypothetical protein
MRAPPGYVYTPIPAETVSGGYFWQAGWILIGDPLAVPQSACANSSALVSSVM